MTAILSLVVAGLALGMGTAQEAPPATGPVRVLVLPFRNETGRAEFDVLGYSIAVTLTEKLAGVARVEVVPGGELRKITQKTQTLRCNIPEGQLSVAGSAVDAKFVAAGAIRAVGPNELEIVGLLMDAKTRKITSMAPLVGSPSDISSAETQLAVGLVREILRGVSGTVPPEVSAPRAAAPEAQLLAASASRSVDEGDLALTLGEIDSANKHYDDAARGVGDGIAAQEGAVLANAFESVCRDILAANPNHVGAIVDLGLIHCRRGDYSQAIHAYLRALEISPNEAVIHYHLALAYRGAGRTQEAIQSYEKAIALDRSFALAHNNLAVLYEDLGEYDKAIELYRKAVAAGGQSQAAALAGTNLGVALIRKGDLEAAVAALSNAIAIDPKLGDALYDRGVAYQQLNKLAEAERDYRAALEAGAKQARVYSNLGVTLYLQDKDEEAIAEYLRALAVDPKFASAYRNLAIVYEKLANKADSTAGMARESAEYWSKALQNWQAYLRGEGLSDADRALARKHVEWIQKYKGGGAGG